MTARAAPTQQNVLPVVVVVEWVLGRLGDLQFNFLSLCLSISGRVSSKRVKTLLAGLRRVSRRRVGGLMPATGRVCRRL